MSFEKLKRAFVRKILRRTYNQYDVLDGADALMIMTEWPVFRTPDFDKMKNLMKNNVIFDGRNLYDPTRMEEIGFTYYSIGRRSVNAK